MCVNVKVKWSRYRPGLAQRVGRVITLLFHDRGTRRGWVVSNTPRLHFTLRERPSTHFTGGWVGPRAGLDGRKISSPTGNYYVCRAAEIKLWIWTKSAQFLFKNCFSLCIMLLFALVLQSFTYVQSSSVVYGSESVCSVTVSGPSQPLPHWTVINKSVTAREQKLLFYEVAELATTLTNACVHPFLPICITRFKTLVMLAAHSRIFGLSAVVFVHVLGQPPPPPNIGTQWC
jgi:hypothetical protein